MVSKRLPLTVISLVLLKAILSNAFNNPKSGSFGIGRWATSANRSTTTRVHLFEMFNAGKKALVRQLAGDYDQDAVRARLDGLIKDNSVLFLSFETCPYCVKAKAILDEKKCRYTNVDLQKDPEGKALRAEMGERLGRTSVPAIWINGEFIGGCNDGPMGGIASLKENGKLDAMLSAAGAL